nr:MAG TPA: hypothetical protein [Caudoviricetes sp.]
MKTSMDLNNTGNIVYTRQQKGHSVLLAVCTACYFGFGIPLAIYWTVSPNHYWHL